MRLLSFSFLFGSVALSLSAQNLPSVPGPIPVLPAPVAATTAPLSLDLPTDNRALLSGDSPGFYMYVDRIFENQVSTPWEGGQYGYVRGPVRHGMEVVMMAFHEGIDIAPLKRDALGEPIDEVRSISSGLVVHTSLLAGASNYGKYVVVQHDWAEGSFFSLYAHLSQIAVQPGQTVAKGTPLGVMGHTGSGLNQKRSHLHLELNLLLSSRFDEWHAKNFRPSPNRHGIYNGLNLAGVDIAGFLIAHHKSPSLSIAEFVKSTEAGWKVVVPRKDDLELVKHYPWLRAQAQADAPSPSWEITLSSSGLPLEVKPSAQIVTLPQVVWVKDRGMPHGYQTRGHVAGSGNKGVLTVSGARFVELLTGNFVAPPAPIPVNASTKKK